MAPLVESFSSATSLSESSSRSDSSSSDSRVEQTGQGSLAHDVEARSMGECGCKKEDSTRSTG